MKQRITYIIIFFSIPFFMIFPQDKKVVISEGSCIGENLTPYEARKHALSEARMEAIKQVVGLEITEESFRGISEIENANKQQIFDSFFRLTNTKSNGRIIREHILNWHTELTDNIPVYHVKIQATVVIEETTNDPSFKVNLSLNKDVFYDGKDELTFKISATQDCYLFLFNLMANDSVQIILPNKYILNTFYDHDANEQFYESQINELGISFPISLRSKTSSDFEALYLVALKDKRDAISFPFQHSANLESFSTQKAFVDLQSWLINIPINKRTEVIKSFEIRSIDASNSASYMQYNHVIK